MHMTNELTEWMTIDQARKVAQVGAKTLYREIKSKRLRAARIGLRRDIRIHRDWISEWLERCSTPIEIGGRR